MDVTECRKSYLGFGMKKKGRNIVRQKKTLRLVYMAMNQKGRLVVERVDSFRDGLSCLKLPSKGLGRRKM